MQDTANQEFSSNDPWSEHGKGPIPGIPSVPTSSPSPLYPVDESDDFHDPFSDLSLFLSEKIKTSIEKNGSAKQWSSKIQNDLLSSILPEFKTKFPKYRLGISALKKVWEKVSYYYGKIQGQKEALTKDGKINVHFMIKENLRQYPTIKIPNGLPPHNFSYQLAIKMSECIATVDGTKPRIDHLTETVWAVHKHLIKDLPTQQAKKAFDSYTNSDKLIVKTLLEKTAEHPFISQKGLQQSILNSLEVLKDICKTISHERLYSICGKYLARKLYEKSSLHFLLSQEEKTLLSDFIKSQIELSQIDKTSDPEALKIETTQRILALYPLSNCLPRVYNEKDVKSAIKYIYNLTTQTPLQECPEINNGIFAFINAEMHFLKRKKEFYKYDKIEAIILNTLEKSLSLPHWKEDFSEDLEIFVWKIFDEIEADTEPSKGLSLITQELSHNLLESPTSSYKHILYQTLQFFKRCKSILVSESKKDEECIWDEIKHKTFLWSIQSDMICKWIHFDETSELLQFITKLNKKVVEDNLKLTHCEFVEKATDMYLDKHKHLSSETDALMVRIWILYKYIWYRQPQEDSCSSFDKFIAWHCMDINCLHSEKAADEKSLILRKRIVDMLPLTPYNSKHHKCF